MNDDQGGFAQARERLEDLVSQVRRKDTSLEQALDLLEEGVKLASECTERVDQTEWRTASEEVAEDGTGSAEDGEQDAEASGRGEAADEEDAASVAASPSEGSRAASDESFEDELDVDGIDEG